MNTFDIGVTVQVTESCVKSLVGRQGKVIRICNYDLYEVEFNFSVPAQYGDTYTGKKGQCRILDASLLIKIDNVMLVTVILALTKNLYKVLHEGNQVYLKKSNLTKDLEIGTDIEVVGYVVGNTLYVTN